MLMPSEYNQGSTDVNNYSSLTVYDRGYRFQAMKYGERLRTARVHAKLTQQQLADRINNVCTQENISKLERSDATGSEFTAQFAEACGVRAMWLAEGQGDMVDGLYVHDERIKHLVQVCQDLADYDVQRLVQAGDALKELSTKTKKPA
ncbi:helix-turn-helix transcriptional regulator [Thiobacillus sp. 65-1402]|uniref:helix-turn-helix domain-containing protein n=1 Tax=Thiobacillus sp. 65-1402 TaxID=1895861 RepID=UPI0025EE89B1|nr:helix-turn-helix transcriptional regulator [Thiobacillus sp. 65-1402]